MERTVVRDGVSSVAHDFVENPEAVRAAITGFLAAL
jgi:hypothetical protein